MDASRDAGSIPAASTRTNLRDIASWPCSLAYGKSLAISGFTASNRVQTEVRAGEFLGPIRLEWIASAVAISQVSKKSPGYITVGNQVGTAMRRESDFPSKAGVGGFLAGLILKSLRPESHEFGSLFRGDFPSVDVRNQHFGTTGEPEYSQIADGSVT